MHQRRHLRISTRIIVGAILTMASAAVVSAGPGAASPAPQRVVITPAVTGLTATAHPTRGGGALLVWHTKSEKAVVGYAIFRRKPGQKRGKWMTARLVAGSFGRLGDERRSTKLRVYRLFDPAGRKGDRYWVKDVNTAGKAVMHGPFTVKGAVVKRQVTSPLVKPPKKKPTGTGTTTTTGPPVTTAPVTGVIPTSDPPTTVQGILASSQTVQIGVNQTGWYHVPLSSLQNAGVDTSVPANLHVFTGGQEIAIAIVNNGVEFYGQAMNTIDTATRIYTVQAETGPGPRIPTASVAPNPPDGPTSFQTTSTEAGHGTYDATALPSASTNFFGDVITSSTTDETVTTPDVASPTSATLTVSLQGVTTNNHAVTVSLNGTPVGTVSWSGLSAGTATFPATSVTSGNNTIALTATTSGDVSLTGPISISYQHGMAADGDQLTASLAGGDAYNVGGFSSPGQVRVYDVSNPASPVSLPVQATGTGVSFTTQSGGAGTVIAFDPDDVLSPASITTAMPSYWNTPNNSGALTIITTPALAPALQPLIARREAEGMSVAVVDIGDIENEFTYGEDDHTAITDFLNYARANWQTPPQYVLLAGDGTYDPRGYLGNDAAANVLPVDLINTSTDQTASDTELTGTADTGRFPAQTEAQLAQMVNKDLLYESATPTDSAVLANGVSDTSDFGASEDALEPLLPPSWSYTRIDADTQPNARSLLLGALSAGPSIVNYSGHGSTTFLSNNILTSADAANLTNTQNPSLYVMMTCLSAYFISPTTDSLAEALLKAPGGASAVISSTGQGTPDPEDAANQALYTALFSSGSPVRLGDAFAAAVNAAGQNDTGTTLTLLGDPTELVP